MNFGPQDVPRLNLVPRPPAGLPSSHSSRSIRQKAFYEAQQGETFGPKSIISARRTIKMSQRVMNAAKEDKKKYNEWLERWDHDPGIKRYLMIKDITVKYVGYSKSQLDEVFGHSSELVFMHIVVFLRWNYQSLCSVALQMKCLQIFFKASSGFVFAEHFLMKGGTEILLYFLNRLKDLSDEDVLEVIKTFIALSEHGPYAIQYICDTKFIEVFLDAIPEFKSEEVHKLCVVLLVQLAEGNIQTAESFTNAILSKFLFIQTNLAALYTAARAFRLLFIPKIASECDIKNHISEFLILPSSESIDIQHEAVIIFHTLLENANPIRKKYILDTLYELINVNLEDLPPNILDAKMRQQTFALKLIQAIAANKKEAYHAFLPLIQKFLPALVRNLANTRNFSSQKAACSAIGSIVSAIPLMKIYLCNAVPREWVDQMISSPHSFCINLNQTQIDTFSTIESSMFFFDKNIEDLSEGTERRQSSKQFQTSSLPKLYSPRRITTAKTNIRQSIILRDSPVNFNLVTNPVIETIH
ncbi:hypothetical protein TVAG_028120 [Trichomonas vaginalis G3]|uniref:Uncharacterized protein n=1 Tax=Trichomonas vaginalis (strain ATCC PRA-98 / G3) TaxID=412133 RepID=A2E551_TRIV3|nr:armadillo-like helical domain containing protein 1 family [Trichomonas vaginalis G3]EAY12259.1 hypothetical protein TVAG_028120 [Trichomonas vaginalis G3]KAI5535934.1 armadillo-like helical domain containing protein 1 family [Trichomonas vaginalis G3]|eukprot:XP_001324482.1 hypothetical protein [Trichomonas vaginalis G3]